MTEHCPACPFRGCDGCDYQGGAKPVVKRDITGTMRENGPGRKDPGTCVNRPGAWPNRNPKARRFDTMSVPTRDISRHPFYATWMSRIDGCPECVDNTEAPRAVEDTGDGGFNAHYRCTDCGHRWETAWWDEPFAGGAR